MIDTKPIVDLKTTVPLRVADFDRFNQLKPSAVLSIFQEAATHHSEILGIGHDDMMKQGVFWAVVRSYYEVIEQVPLYSDVIVRTWPHDPSRFSILRDYTVFTPQGETLMVGTSEWVFMDVETRSFVPLSTAYEAPDNILSEKNFEKKPRKIHDFEADPSQGFVIVPPYTSVDLNGHVNNCCYADYPLDALDPDAPLNIRSFQIDYRHEVHAGKPLRIHNLKEDATLLTKGVDDEGNIMFAARTVLGQ